MAAPVEQTTGGRLVFEDSIEVPAPIGEVYRRWTDFPHFPEFMGSVETVRPTGNNRYHWIARILGAKQEWEAEVTDQQPNSHISWRSIAGPQNQGTVSFRPLSSGNTGVRLRMEYAPPGGKTGQLLDQATRTTKREVHKDLDNFRRLFTEEGAQMEALGMGEPMSQGGLGEILGKFTFPAAAIVAGGTVAWYLEKAREERMPRFRQMSRQVSRVEPAAQTASWILAALAAGGLVASGTLRSQNRKKDALFVGQWVPTLLECGILARLAGHMEVHPPRAVVAASYGLAAAALASILTSFTIHARGRRTDGLFVGHWAPTFLAAAIMTRLIGSRM